MSTTLSYGYKKPQDGDIGSSWSDDLEFDIQQLNDHTHDGVTSALLTKTSVSAVSHSVNNTVTADLTTGWVLQADGGYKRTIAISSFFSSLTFDTIGTISWRVYTSTSAGEYLWDIFYPTIEKIGPSTYNVTTNMDVTTVTTPYFKVVYM